MSRDAAEPELLRRAYDLAAEAHEGQRRRGNQDSYVTHPLEVARCLRDEGFGDEVLAAAILHDAVENSEIELSDIVREFGQRIAELVASLTEDPSIEDWGERKRSLRRDVVEAGPDAVAIYAADKLTNVKDTRVLYAREGEGSGQRFEVSLDERVGAWRDDLETVAGCGGNERIVNALRAELDGLHQDRARERNGAPATN
jgi:(p)ppGpp synthase/HD superfamily hydrolase